MATGCQWYPTRTGTFRTMKDDMTTRLEEHSKLLRQFAELFFQSVSQALPAWEEAYFDFRLGSSECGLDRAIVRSQNTRIGIDLPVELFEIQDGLLELRNQIPGGDWYGLFVHIDRQGNVDVKYDHNSACIETFADDERLQRPF